MKYEFEYPCPKCGSRKLPKLERLLNGDLVVWCGNEDCGHRLSG